MRSRIAKIFYVVLICAIVFGIGIFITNRLSEKRGTAKIIAANFVGYDFTRAVTGDGSQVSMLVKPGSETHSFEPTPEDIINIKNADLFIYTGGESDDWVEKLLENNQISEEKVLRMMDIVEVKEEKIVEGMEGEHEEEVEYDEHVWTSPKNAIKILDGIRDKLAKIYPENAEKYEKNTAEYTEKIAEIDAGFRKIVNSANKKELIFGDRFPFRYFVDEYGLEYYAAFPGCSEQTEASSNTVAFLVDKAREDGIKVILKIELTSDKLAKTIADEVNAKVLELNAAHNISQENFERGVTYVDIMGENIEAIREALE